MFPLSSKKIPCFAPFAGRTRITSQPRRVIRSMVFDALAITIRYCVMGNAPSPECRSGRAVVCLNLPLQYKGTLFPRQAITKEKAKKLMRYIMLLKVTRPPTPAPPGVTLAVLLAPDHLCVKRALPFREAGIGQWTTSPGVSRVPRRTAAGGRDSSRVRHTAGVCSITFGASA